MIYKGKDCVSLESEKFQVDLLKKGFKKIRGNRSIRKIVIHWDVCKSTEDSIKVFKRRGLSTHFSIDQDGTIYQLVDINDRAFHAKGHNTYTIGIDLNNPYYLKHQDKDNPRPVIESKVHGHKLGKHLGFTKEQIESLIVLLDALCTEFDIEFKTPEEAGESKEAKKHSYKGIIGHYHLTKNKIDPSGLDFQKIIEILQKKSLTNFFNTLDRLFK